MAGNIHDYTKDVLRQITFDIANHSRVKPDDVVIDHIEAGPGRKKFSVLDMDLMGKIDTVGSTTSDLGPGALKDRKKALSGSNSVLLTITMPPRAGAKLVYMVLQKLNAGKSIKAAGKDMKEIVCLYGCPAAVNLTMGGELKDYTKKVLKAIAVDIAKRSRIESKQLMIDGIVAGTGGEKIVAWLSSELDMDLMGKIDTIGSTTSDVGPGALKDRKKALSSLKTVVLSITMPPPAASKLVRRVNKLLKAGKRVIAGGKPITAVGCYFGCENRSFLKSTWGAAVASAIWGSKKKAAEKKAAEKKAAEKKAAEKKAAEKKAAEKKAAEKEAVEKPVKMAKAAEKKAAHSSVNPTHAPTVVATKGEFSLVVDGTAGLNSKFLAKLDREIAKIASLKPTVVTSTVAHDGQLAAERAKKVRQGDSKAQNATGITVTIAGDGVDGVLEAQKIVKKLNDTSEIAGMKLYSASDKDDQKINLGNWVNHHTVMFAVFCVIIAFTLLAAVAVIAIGRRDHQDPTKSQPYTEPLLEDAHAAPTQRPWAWKSEWDQGETGQSKGSASIDVPSTSTGVDHVPAAPYNTPQTPAGATKPTTASGTTSAPTPGQIQASLDESSTK
jgi:hypothetical protein